MKAYKRRGPKAVRRCLLQPRRNGRVFTRWAATFFVLVVAVAVAPAGIKARQKPANSRRGDAQQVQAQPVQPIEGTHRFFDRTNLLLFAGVAAVRALDYTSTQHFRSLGNNEVLLTNSIVDNKPLFAGIEVAGTALSIGAAWWLHRTGHHKLERWISVVHIAVGTFGDAHNYSLGPAR